MQTCYDPAPPPTNDCYTNFNYQEVRNGESIKFIFYCDFEDELTVTIYTSEKGNLQEELGEVLQSEKMTLTPEVSEYELTVDVGDYTGIARVRFEYNLHNDDSYGISEHFSESFITIVE
jgi:hypothetical protein